MLRHLDEVRDGEASGALASPPPLPPSTTSSSTPRRFAGRAAPASSYRGGDGGALDAGRCPPFLLISSMSLPVIIVVTREGEVCE